MVAEAAILAFCLAPFGIIAGINSIADAFEKWPKLAGHAPRLRDVAAAIKARLDAGRRLAGSLFECGDGS